MEFNDDSTVVAELKARVREFVSDRDWDQYHFPKDLAIGLAIEAAELLEQFRFRSNEEIESLMADPGQRRLVAHELADVLYFVLLMCANLGLDASSILAEKLALSAERYPVEKVRGRNLKYTELQTAAGEGKGE
jgi:NTP pyrophosphatase (non-canonical NTP hydrolase)